MKFFNFYCFFDGVYRLYAMEKVHVIVVNVYVMKHLVILVEHVKIVQVVLDHVKIIEIVYYVKYLVQANVNLNVIYVIILKLHKLIALITILMIKNVNLLIHMTIVHSRFRMIVLMIKD